MGAQVHCRLTKRESSSTTTFSWLPSTAWRVLQGIRYPR